MIEKINFVIFISFQYSSSLSLRIIFMEELAYSLYNQTFIAGKTLTWHAGKMIIL